MDLGRDKKGMEFFSKKDGDYYWYKDRKHDDTGKKIKAWCSAATAVYLSPFFVSCLTGKVYIYYFLAIISECWRTLARRWI